MAESKRYEITVSPKVTFLAEQSDPDKSHFVFAYTITLTNTGSVAAQLVSRHWIITDAEQRVQEVTRAGRRRQAAGAEAGRELRVHERHQHRDAGRHDARLVPDARGGRPRVRRSDRAVHAVDSAHAALIRVALSLPCRTRRASFGTAVRRNRAAFAAARGACEAAPIVHATIATRIANAISDSNSNHSTDGTPHAASPATTGKALRTLDDRRARCIGRMPDARTAASRATRRTRTRRSSPRPLSTRCRAGTRIARRLRGRRFASAARRSSSASARGRSGSRRAPPPRSSTRKTPLAVRQFFEANFTPYRVTATDGARRRTRHRLLRAAAARLALRRSGVSVAALCAARRPRWSSNWPTSIRSSRASACADDSKAAASFRTGRAPTSTRGKANVAGKALVYVDRSGRRVLPADPGLGPRSSSPKAA